jgi:hypothetical protein
LYINEISNSSAALMVGWEMMDIKWTILNNNPCLFADGTIHFDNVNLDNTYGPFKAYRQSKLANVLFSSELARKLEGKAGG